jgi:geranylgeranyl reductase family protein
VAEKDPTNPPRPDERSCDVLVVGAGPSGSAASYWLARAGLDVVMVEKKQFPREKTCGDGLTPRSVAQLAAMGLESALAASHHRYRGLRSVAFGRMIEMEWPAGNGLPDYGYTVTRHDLDALVAANAEKAGAELWQGAEAVGPLLPPSETGRAPAGGAYVTDKERGTTTKVKARCVVVADGSLSRFGRALGTSRVKAWPQGMAIRGYFSSPRHDDPFIESHLDIRDKDGKVVPGYGWIFPLGDGRVNVGIGLLSTSERWKGLNTTKLMADFVGFAPQSWCISPETALGEPTGGRLPMGLAVGPRVGPDWVVVGDAAGAINPFNGEGIAYGYETGRTAAQVITEALGAGDLTRLASYEDALQAEYGRYYAVARAFVKAIGNPQVMRACVRSGMYVKPVMEWMLRIMANLTRPELAGPPEVIYAGLDALAGWNERRKIAS